MFVGGILLLALAGGLWWHAVYSSPQNTFERMLENSLSTTSVTKIISQSNNGQTTSQSVQIITAPQHTIHSINKIEQDVGGKTVIVTEETNTPQADFVRYNSIETQQKSESGQSFDFSTVLGIWGKTDYNSKNPYAQSTVYSQNVFGVVPIANLPLEKRQKLLNQITNDNVYKVDYANVAAKIENHRPTYTYTVTVTPVSYIKMVKILGQYVGLKQLEQLDPARYAGAQPVSFGFKVDVWSGQLLSVSYPGSDRQESYTAYGQIENLVMPSSTIPLNQLQDRLQQIQ